jgi:predicted metal-dependent hydrolase
MGTSRGELPAFTVRESSRARHVRLTVTPQDGLVVVVPRGARVDAREIVASKRAWAVRSLAKVADKRALHVAGPEALLPESVALPLVGIDLPVDYVFTPSVRASVTARSDRLVVRGPVDAVEQLRALNVWLDKVAHESLPNRLEAVAQDAGVRFVRCRITRANSRWGSCSSRGTISLNRSLLFFPTELVDALILHELAHVAVMNHSPQFWAHLATLDPDSLAHRARLKKAGAFVPAWADA